MASTALCGGSRGGDRGAGGVGKGGGGGRRRGGGGGGLNSGGSAGAEAASVAAVSSRPHSARLDVLSARDTDPRARTTAPTNMPSWVGLRAT